MVDRDDLEAFLQRAPGRGDGAARPRRAGGCASPRKLLRRTVSRDINEEVEDKRTTVMKMADWISEFSGSLPFLFIHCVLFALWIVLNTGPLGAHARSAAGIRFPTAS